MNMISGAGYQLDYVFDWTILKYPQIGSSSRVRIGALLICCLLALLYFELVFVSYIFLSYISSQWGNYL